MATITSRVQIEMLDQDNHTQTFNIDYPKQNMTLGSIRISLNDAIATNSWCSSYAVPFQRVNKATLVETEKTQLSNEGDGISVTPTEANLTATGNMVTQTFTVTGIDIEGYNYIHLSGNLNTINPNYNLTTIDESANTITAAFNTPSAGTAQFNFVIVGSGFTLTVPITITKA